MSREDVVQLVPMTERPLSQRVAANIRAEMARYGLQQADVAQALHISQQSVSLKIHGKRPISLDELDGFARIFGLTAADLVADTRSPRSGGPGGGFGTAGDSPARPEGLEPPTFWSVASAPVEDDAALAAVVPFRPRKVVAS